MGIVKSNGVTEFGSMTGQHLLEKCLVRPDKVVYFSGCKSRPGRLANHRVASPWRLHGNMKL